MRFGAAYWIQRTDWPALRDAALAAEAGADIERAQAKRLRKGVDLIVLNDVARSDIGFEVDANEVALVGPDGVEHLPKASKAAVAAAILDRVESLLA